MIKRLFNKRHLKLFISLLVLIAILVSMYYIDLYRFNSKLEKYDSEYLMKITYLVGDKETLSTDVTIDETVIEHSDSILYTTSQFLPLTKDGDYLYVDLNKFTNDVLLNDVTDVIYTKYNTYGQLIEGCSYDKETRILKIPYSYYEKENRDQEVPVQVEIESLLTKKQIKNIKTDFNVKKLITYSGKASNELLQLDTKISLSNYINGNLSKDNIYIYINNSDKPVSKDDFLYDYKTDVITINIPSILIDKVDIRLGNNIFKNVFASVDVADMYAWLLDSPPASTIVTGTTWLTSWTEPGYGELIYCVDGSEHAACSSDGYVSPSSGASDVDFDYSYFKDYYGIYGDLPDDEYVSMWDARTYAINPYLAETNFIAAGYLSFHSPNDYIVLSCANHDYSGPSSGTGSIRLEVHVEERGSDYMVLRIMTNNGTDSRQGWDTQIGLSYIKVRWEETSKCNLTVQKTVSSYSDSGTGTATFGVYSDSSCSTLVGTTKNVSVNLNNGTGTATFNDLSLNTDYWVKELSFVDSNSNNLLANKYSITSDNCFKVTTRDSDGDGACDQTPSIVNSQRKYCYAIKKVDAENNSTAVNGTTWTLTGADNQNYPGTVGSNGVITFSNLKYQTYTLKETSADPADLNNDSNPDYWNDNKSNYSVTLDKLKTDGTCTTQELKADTKVYYCIKVKKVDYNTGTALTGAEFTATKGNITIDKNSSNYATANGITSFFIGDSSKAGTYTITETKAPTGYTIDTASKSVSAIAMSKYQNEAAARTACLSDNATASDGSTIASKTYNSNNGNNNYVFKEKKLVLNFYKTIENGTTLTNGAEFKVKNSSETYITVSTPVVTTDANGVQRACYVYTGTSGTGTMMTTGANGSTGINMNGEICVAGLPAGNYTVEEKNPAPYHTYGSVWKLTNMAASSTFASKTNANTIVNYRTEFEFTKDVSSGDTTINGINWNSITSSELNNLSFNITDTNGNVLSFIQTSAGVYEYSGNTIDAPSGTPVTDLKLGSNRKIKVYHLPIGSYYIKEKKVCCDTSCNSCTQTGTCSGYYYPNYSQESTYRFEITDCSSSSATSCGSTGVVATKSLTNTPTEITFTKRDLYSYADPTAAVKFENEDEVNAFDNIKFRLKDENGNYVKLMKVGNTGTCKTDSSYAEYRYVDESLLTAAERANLVTDLYTCGGHIKITHLCRGKKYTIEEYEVPANTVFTLPDAHITKDYLIPFAADGSMCCNDKPVTTTITQVIEDTPTRIELNKKNNRTSTDIHEGQTKKQTATFEVYACTNLNATCTKATSTGNKIKFGSKRTLGSETVYPALLNQTGSGTTSLELTTEGNKGKLVLEYLPANYRYVVVETNGPDGYYNVTGALAETEIEYIPKNTTSSSANLKSIIDYPTMIKFKKDDLYKYYKKTDADKLSSSNKIFDTMTFVLRDKDGNIVSLSKIADGEYRFIKDDGTTTGNNVTELHPKNGEILITNIYRNEKYYIEETKTDTKGNFILPTNIKKPSGIPSGWTWAGHPYVIYDLSTNLPTDTQGGTVPSESVTQLIENLPTRVVFEKRDKMTGELIDDSEQSVRTTFNVYRCPNTVAHCRSNSQGAELVYFDNRTYVTDGTTDITSDLTSVTPPVLTYKYSKLNATSGAVSDLVTDRGVLVLAYLPSEYSYSLYEKTASNGYYQPTNNEAYTDFTVLGTTAGENINYVELTERVENTPTEIYFIKSDLYNYYDADDLASNEDNTTKIFDSMSFILRDRNGNVLQLKCSSEGNFVSNKNTESKCDTGEYRYVPVDNNNVIEAMHTKNGNIKVTHLLRGETYYIEEVSNDTHGNFTLPDYLNVDLNYGDQLPFDNNGHPVVKYILPNNTPADQTSVTAEIKNIPTRVRFEKRDAKYNYLIADQTATFKVYQCDVGTECHPADYSTDEERLAAGIRLVNFTPRALINGDGEDDGVEVYKYSKLNANNVTELHPDKGVLVLRYLPSDSNYTYVLLETVAPINYLLPTGREAETPFDVVSTTTSVEEVNVPNSPTALIIRKYADIEGDGEADSDKLLGGAKFRVYKVTNYNANVSIKDQEKELIKLKTIKDGIYENRPVLDTDVITTCTGDNCSYSLDDSLGYTSTPWESIDDLIESSGDNITSVLKEGTALVQYLEYDTYYVVEEVEAPVGYSLPENDDNRFTLVHIRANETEIVDTRDALVNKPTSFTFYKFDEYNTPLDGATFYLQKLDDDKKYNTLTVSRETLANGNIIYRADPNSELTDITTNEGHATVYYLEPGQYRILEVAASEGYELPKKTINVATFFVDYDGLVYGNNIITNKKPAETIEYLASDKAELIINIQTGKVVVKYGLIITALIGAIVGLMIFLKKRK